MKAMLAIGLSIGLGVAMVAGAGTALAQMPPGPPGGPQGGPHEGGWRHGDEGEMGWHHHHDGHHDEMGAHFHFRKGDSDIDIHCASEESLQACVSAATTLIDKLNGTSQSGKTTQ